MSTQPNDSQAEIFERLESEVRSYCRNWPVVFDRASGCEQTTEDGVTYLDFFSGAGALNYGHNNPVLKQAMLDYFSEDRVIHSMDMFSVAKRTFLHQFEDIILKPRNMNYRVMFTGPTGTNAVESALKLARKVTDRTQVVSFVNAFHGMTLGSLAVTGNEMKRQGAGIALHHTTVAPYDDYLDHDGHDFDWLRRVWSDAGSGIDLPAAVIVEAVQGAGGLNAARLEWLRQLGQRCKEFDVKLILDDIQAGCGRTGTFFSWEEAGIEPDMITLSKSLSGLGLPMAIVLLKPELDAWQPGEHNGTFRGFNPAFITATAALEEYWRDDSFAATVRERSAQLKAGLEKIAEEHGAASYRGRGLLAGIGFETPELGKAVATEAFERKLLVETCGAQDEVVKTMPPLTISSEDLQRGIDILADAVKAVA